MTGFNLVRDPWVPIGAGTVSIRDALVRAHELPGWPSGDFGLAEVVLRLLIPMTYRITGLDEQRVGASDELFAEEQMAWFKRGRFDESIVDSYLNRHFDRFWLLDAPDGYPPFAQDPTLEGVDPHEAAKAVTGWASGNNPVLGPHTDTGELAPDLAAQRLLVLRAYAWGGLHTKHPAWCGQGKFVGGPLRGTMSVHPVGTSLAETLVAHLVPLPGGNTGFGKPFWEQPVPQNPVAAHQGRAGLLEQIAGQQDKTMLLRTNVGRITGFTIAEGPGVDRNLFCEDPYLLLKPDLVPKKPRAQKAFWRETEALLKDATDRSGRREARSRVLDWASGEYSDLYATEKFSWVVVSHLGDRSKDMVWSRSVAPDLLRLFRPDTTQRALGFLSLTNEAESLMAKQLAKAWHATDQMPSKPEDKAAAYRPARAEFWKRNERDFWQTVTGDVTQREIKDRIRLHALAGFDLATDRSVRNQRALPAIVESRKWIERWERPKGSADQQSASDEQEQIS